MKRHHFGNLGTQLLHIDEATPACGEYCDVCGDCLKCYGEDPCAGVAGKDHYWVVYEDSEDDVRPSEFMTRHYGALSIL